MTQNLTRLVQQTYKLIPQFSKSLQKVSPQNLFVNYPLQLVNDNTKNTFTNSVSILKSQNLIRSNNHILLIHANQFFASTSFLGAGTVQQDSLNLKLQQLKTKYQIFDDDMLARIKLTLAIQANSLDEDMQLHSYAKYILKNKKHPEFDNFIKSHTNSGFLKSVLHSNKLAVSTAHDYLHKSFLQQVKLQDFSSAYQMVRYFSKQTNKVRVVFPFSNHIKHSFQPNCQIKAVYLTHRRQTFLTLTSIKQINPGDILTINYGNQNNYELFVRYGFTIPDNPFSEFYLPVDFSQIDEIFNSNMQWKTMMFKKNKDLKLRNFIRINTQGKINAQDLNMMKIVFSSNPLTSEQFNSDGNASRQLQNQIYSFARITGNKFSKMFQKMVEKKNQILKQEKPQSNEDLNVVIQNIRTIQTQQKAILNKLINSA